MLLAKMCDCLRYSRSAVRETWATTYCHQTEGILHLQLMGWGDSSLTADGLRRFFTYSWWAEGIQGRRLPTKTPSFHKGGKLSSEILRSLPKVSHLSDRIIEGRESITQQSCKHKGKGRKIAFISPNLLKNSENVKTKIWIFRFLTSM